MQATITNTGQRKPGEHARARAIIRFNGLMFHSLAAASFLETVAPLHVNRCNPALAAHPGAAPWLERIWSPQRAELGRRLRAYVEATWPEFDWNAAYDEFCADYRPRPRTGRGRSGVALEAFGLCVAEAQAALFYRALARGADDAALRELGRQAAAEHATCFDYFRAIFERRRRPERAGFAQCWRALSTACRSARDLDVRAAFEPLGRCWKGQRTLPELAYGEFVPRMAQTIQRYAATGLLERILFRSWLVPERPALVPAPAEPARAARPSPVGLQPAW